MPRIRSRQPPYARSIGVTLLLALQTACGGGGVTTLPVPRATSTPPAAVQISVDRYVDPLGQHASEVEPSAAVRGQTVVAAFQVARQYVAGGSAIGVATSFDGGRTWAAQSLPFVTRLTGGTAQSASDAVVAYDAAHAVWLVASIPIVGASVPYPEVSLSPDGVHWGAPVAVGSGDVSDDKEWVACDDSFASPYYGHCYMAWDDDGRNGLLESSVSTDGGRTWSAPKTSGDRATGIGAQPVPQPNGDVAIVTDDYNEASVFAFLSHDGGATWSASRPVAPIVDHFQRGNLRGAALVSAAVDDAGTIYAVWQDCRFEPACRADDLVLSRSADALSWSAPARIPLDAVNSGVDHFIPGLGVDQSAGAPAKLGLTYYTYANAECVPACALSASYAGSTDGGNSWSPPATLGNSMSLGWLANTTEGAMVADYVATVFSAGEPIGIFAQAFAPSGALNEAMYAYRPPQGTIAQRRTLSRDRPIPGARSDHPARHLKPAG